MGALFLLISHRADDDGTLYAIAGLLLGCCGAVVFLFTQVRPLIERVRRAWRDAARFDD